MMGRDAATLALAIVSTKDEAHFKRSAAGILPGWCANASAASCSSERACGACGQIVTASRRAGASIDRALGRGVETGTIILAFTEQYMVHVHYMRQYERTGATKFPSFSIETRPAPRSCGTGCGT